MGDETPSVHSAPVGVRGIIFILRSGEWQRVEWTGGRPPHSHYRDDIVTEREEAEKREPKSPDCGVHAVAHVKQLHVTQSDPRNTLSSVRDEFVL